MSCCYATMQESVSDCVWMQSRSEVGQLQFSASGRQCDVTYWTVAECFVDVVPRTRVTSRPDKGNEQHWYVELRVRCFSVTSLCWLCHSLPSARQHLSYGDCLEVKREYYQNCSMLGGVTQCSQSAAHLCEQFLQVSRLGLSHWDPYAMHRSGCLELLYYCNMVEWCWWDSSLICKTSWFPSVLWHCWFGHMTCKNRPRYDLQCVWWCVKPLHYYYYYSDSVRDS